MPLWFTVCEENKLRPNTFRLVDFDDIEVMVFNINGSYYAIEDVCTHDGAALSDGELKGCEIICARHGARFDVRTGEVTAPPAYENIRCFPTRVKNGSIQVCDDRD